jgi:hypothetical protein
MAIAVVYRPPEMTAEQYNTSWSGSDGPPLPVPPGLVFHAGVWEGSKFFHDHGVEHTGSIRCVRAPF